MKRIFDILAKFGPILAAIGRNAVLDIDTVHKTTGVFMRVRIEIYGYKIIDRLVPWPGTVLAPADDGRTLEVEQPVDPKDTLNIPRPVDVMAKNKG